MKRYVATARDRIGRSGVLLIVSLLTWYGWVLISGATSQYDLEFTSPYLVAPVVLVLGIGAGGFLRRQWQRGKVFHIFVVLLAVSAVSRLIYDNASAAAGGLLIALVGLGARPQRSDADQPRIVRFSRDSRR